MLTPTRWQGEIATAFTLARILSNIPLCRGGPADLIIFDIHALQALRPLVHLLPPCGTSDVTGQPVGPVGPVGLGFRFYHEP